jgi:hypothetical protein
MCAGIVRVYARISVCARLRYVTVFGCRDIVHAALVSDPETDGPRSIHGLGVCVCVCACVCVCVCVCLCECVHVC